MDKMNSKESYKRWKWAS